MKASITVFATLLAVAAALRPLHISRPVLPKYTAFEWQRIMANQHLPAENNDFSAVPAGTEFQPASSGLAIPPPEGHIINGDSAHPGQFPWQAGVSIDDEAFCGGSLIAPKVVLTAGHCVHGYSKFSVVLGAHFINEKEPTAVRLVTRNGVPHQEYNQNQILNDIAVLLFDNAFPLSERINPIALPPQSMVSELFEGESLTVSGWGRVDGTMNISPVLQYARLTVLPNERCARYFGGYIRSSSICGDGSQGVSSCNGDSGGPFSVNRNGTEFIIGIVSFGSGLGCDLGYPSVFTRVPSYLAWIQGTTGITITP